jgi:type VI secretion system secreted protein Hcp
VELHLKLNSKIVIVTAIVGGLSVLGLRQVNAGDLNPPSGVPTSTMVTLDDLNNSLAGTAIQTPTSWAGPMAITDANGSTQGLISSGDTVGGFTDAIQIYSYSHQVSTTRDAASGLPTGKRQHKPITIIKPIDKSTPLLMNALVTNENLTTIKFRMFTVDAAGTTNYFTVELVNASVADILHESVGVGGSADPAPREHVSFVYQTIIWTFENGGITAQDDWTSPVV